MIYAVIMAGGSGTRFWPRSRKSLPKQLIPIVSERTMIQETVDRLEGEIPPERILVVATAAIAEEIRRQVPALPERNVIEEPFGRDTAPCIGLAAVLAHRLDEDATMVVMPADHAIKPRELFLRAIRGAADLAQDALITFGVKPTYPATGYGYIHRGKSVEAGSDLKVYALRQFKEKPDLETATRYLETGEFYWNSGIFVWKAKTILGKIERLMPGLFAGLNRIGEAAGTPEWESVLTDEYGRFEKISIDYGIMEKALGDPGGRVLVIEVDYEWDDVGSWKAIERHVAADADGNVVAARHVGIDTTGCIVAGTDRLIATIGVHNLIIVETEDALLICDKDRAEEVKKLVDRIGDRALDSFL